MKEALRLYDPALVLRNEVGLVTYRECNAIAPICHVLLLGGHLPVRTLVTELVHQGVLVFLVGERYPRFSEKVSASLLKTTLVPSQLPLLGRLSFSSLSSSSLHMGKLQLKSMRRSHLGTS